MEAIEAVEDDGKEGLSGDMYRQAIGAPHEAHLTHSQSHQIATCCQMMDVHKQHHAG